MSVAMQVQIAKLEERIDAQEAAIRALHRELSELTEPDLHLRILPMPETLRRMGYKQRDDGLSGGPDG